ncbi:hypothetical protein ACUVF2_004872 [Escherichia coli]
MPNAPVVGTPKTGAERPASGRLGDIDCVDDEPDLGNYTSPQLLP